MQGGTIMVAVLALVLALLLLGALTKPQISTYIEGFLTTPQCPLGMVRKEPEPVPPEEQLLATVLKNIPARVGSETLQAQMIPRHIMQTNERNEVPVQMKDAMDRIVALNPEYAYSYYNDADALAFIAANFSPDVVKAYKKVNPGAFKADLFRYCWLYINGGVYLDTGMNPVRPLREIIRSGDTFVSAEDCGHKAIYNAIMMAVPNHPILKSAIDDSVKVILNEEYDHEMLYITGPGRLRRSFEKIVRKTPIPDTDYGGGVRLIKHDANIRCICGLISQDGVLMLYTKYPRYPRDQVWYNTKKHYGALWYEHKIYLPDSEIA